MVILTFILVIMATSSAYSSGNMQSDDKEAYRKALEELKIYLKQSKVAENDVYLIQIFDDHYDLVKQLHLNSDGSVENRSDLKLISHSDLITEALGTAYYLVQN